MRTLHLIRIGTMAPTGDGAGLIADGDAVVWMEEAVAAVLTGAGEGLPVAVNQFVMGPDLRLRGLADRELPGGVEAIEPARLVDLVVHCDRSLTW